MYHYLDLSMRIDTLDIRNHWAIGMTHFLFSFITSQVLHPPRVTTTLDKPAILMALGLKLAHQIVCAEF